jgi:O-acetyl-ADP-ribose deacetylase (regulator of RNase III)
VEARFGKVRIVIKQGDLTREDADAIINAANSSLMGGGGVDGAIHRAGGPAILEDCKRIVAVRGRLPAGRAVITTGGKLPASHVIHTVGPVYRGGTAGEAALLASCYASSLALAEEQGLAVVAFPAISTGIFGYPFEEACRVSFAAARDFCEKSAAALKEIRFVYFSAADATAATRILAELISA